MSKPLPAHHREVEIPRAGIVDGYSGTFTPKGFTGMWQIVAASSVNLAPGEKLPAEGWVRVIVAPAKAAP